MTSIPAYDLAWGMPVDAPVQRSNREYKRQHELANKALREATGVEIEKVSLHDAVLAVGTLREDAEAFEQAMRWLLGVSYWRLSSQPMEARAALPTWFWEEFLLRLSKGSRFEALPYVSEDSFETGLEMWAKDPAGAPLASINHYRKMRKDTWAMLPEHTFFSLYGLSG